MSENPESVRESDGQGEAKDREVKLEAAKRKLEVESKAIADEIAKQDSAAGHKFLKLGERCHKFLAKAVAVGFTSKDARGMLEADILIATRVDWSKEISRAIKVYHVHCHFGYTVLSLPLDMVKALSTFIHEDSTTGEWGLVSRYADPVTKLYDRVTNGKGKRLTAQEFRAELNRISNPNRTIAGGDTGKDKSSASPAGDKGQDLGRPPIDMPVGAKTNPGNATISILKTLAQSEDETTSAHMLGQKLDSDLIVAIFAGFCDRISQDEDKELAAADWRYLFEELEPLFAKMHAAFPDKQRQAA